MDRPMIAIINTWSDLSPATRICANAPNRSKKRILMAGGYPVELPAMSLGEVLVKPTTMLYRNFLAMEVEELLRSLPCDGVVILAGCDKTTPGTLMGAFSMDIPTMFCPAGTMLNDRYVKDGVARTVGAGTHTRMFWDEYQAGNLDAAELQHLESAHDTRTRHLQHHGHRLHHDGDCRGAGADTAWRQQHSGHGQAHSRMATSCGERIVGMVWEDLKPSTLVTRGSFQNALAVQMALGGSTNAAVHIIAMAGRWASV
jgi:dihydroxyacid dehydratase/phosphogluconate dehydratase